MADFDVNLVRVFMLLYETHVEGSRTLVNLDPATLRPAPLTDAMWTISTPLLAVGVERPAA